MCLLQRICCIRVQSDLHCRANICQNLRSSKEPRYPEHLHRSMHMRIASFYHMASFKANLLNSHLDY